MHYRVSHDLCYTSRENSLYIHRVLGIIVLFACSDSMCICQSLGVTREFESMQSESENAFCECM